MSEEDPYTLPGTTVLRNKFGITDAAELEAAEREWVAQRAMAGVPAGKFNLHHLQAIHRHLFQDIYDWAGKLRTVEIAKGGHQFQFRQYIETGMADVHRRLTEANFLRGLPLADFATQAGAIIGDVNYVHPFREGNGRTQFLYLKQLAQQAGHPIDLRKIRAKHWLSASKSAHKADYSLMATEISRATDPN